MPQLKKVLKKNEIPYRIIQTLDIRKKKKKPEKRALIWNLMPLKVFLNAMFETEF